MQFLDEALASIRNQSYENLEILLIDDGSSDGTLDFVLEQAKLDSRIKVVQNEKNIGLIDTLNKGINLARGEYIARMDADDIALPDRLAKQYNYLQQHPDVGIAGGQVKIFNQRGVAQGFSLYEKWLNQLCLPDDIARELFVESPIPNPTAFFRREVYEALNGYHDPEWAEDYDMWLRAHAMGIKMGKPEGIVLHWRDHEHRLTHCDSRYDNKLFMKAKACYLASNHNYLKNRKAIIWGTGPNGIYLYDILTQQNIEGVLVESKEACRSYILAR